MDRFLSLSVFFCIISWKWVYIYYYLAQDGSICCVMQLKPIFSCYKKPLRNYVLRKLTGVIPSRNNVQIRLSADLIWSCFGTYTPAGVSLGRYKHGPPMTSPITKPTRGGYWSRTRTSSPTRSVNHTLGKTAPSIMVVPRSTSFTHRRRSQERDEEHPPCVPPRRGCRSLSPVLCWYLE